MQKSDSTRWSLGQGDFRVSVNCSIVFTELDLPERFRAARSAGYEAVELWWPFEAPVPSVDQVEGLVDALEEAQVALTGLNFMAGDMPAGDRGLISWPGRSDEFHRNLDAVTRIGEGTGCRLFNALYGNRIPGTDPGIQDDLAVERLALAATAVGRIGGTVLLEAVSGVPTYPLRTAGDVVGVLDRVSSERGVDNLGLLLDVYHLAVNGDSVDEAIARHADRIAHVQLADAPGRGAPGTGDLPIARWLRALDAAGYAGFIGLEHLGAPRPLPL